MKYDNTRFKYRAWGIDEGLYVATMSLLRLEKYIVEFCTGIKDCEEKLIFENDYLEVEFENGNVEKYQVVWKGDEGYPAFELEGFPDYVECNAFSWIINGPDIISFRVVGNIHETEEE